MVLADGAEALESLRGVLALFVVEEAETDEVLELAFGVPVRGCEEREGAEGVVDFCSALAGAGTGTLLGAKGALFVAGNDADESAGFDGAGALGPFEGTDAGAGLEGWVLAGAAFGAANEAGDALVGSLKEGRASTAAMPSRGSKRG